MPGVRRTDNDVIMPAEGIKRMSERTSFAYL